MLYDLFEVLLNSVCKHFTENFCIYVHRKICLLIGVLKPFICRVIIQINVLILIIFLVDSNVVCSFILPLFIFEFCWLAELNMFDSFLILFFLLKFNFYWALMFVTIFLPLLCVVFPYVSSAIKVSVFYSIYIDFSFPNFHIFRLNFFAEFLLHVYDFLFQVLNLFSHSFICLLESSLKTLVIFKSKILSNISAISVFWIQLLKYYRLLEESCCLAFSYYLCLYVVIYTTIRLDDPYSTT
jgi:hypothetical protein